MRKTITISLPKEVKHDFDKATAKEELSRSDLIRESLRDYLFMRRFRQLRSRMMAKAHVQDVRADEDVFKRLV